jgi:predicted metal-dependent enzyme (double-stranded beta helix superfamily)
MFDAEAFIDQCVTANRDGDPRRAVKAVMEEVLSAPSEVVDALGSTTAGLTVLHQSADLTIINVVWAPRMRIFPHDHRMWAAIGLYAGREDNTFFRRDGDRLVESGGKALEERDVALLGDDTIHAVANPLDRYTAAIHVYGGDFSATPRSQWDPTTLVEEPYDIEVVRRAFQAAEAAASG